MNKTTKILLIIGGLTGLAFLTKKYWYKAKSSFYNMEDESEESSDDEEDLEDDEDLEAIDEIAMDMSEDSSDETELNGDSMGGLVNDMGSPESIMGKPMQQSMLQAKAKNSANVNTPNFTPKMPNKSDIAKAKMKKNIKNVAIGVGGLGAIALASKIAKNKKQKLQIKKRKRKSGFSDY